MKSAGQWTGAMYKGLKDQFKSQLSAPSEAKPQSQQGHPEHSNGAQQYLQSGLPSQQGIFQNPQVQSSAQRMGHTPQAGIQQPLQQQYQALNQHQIHPDQRMQQAFEQPQALSAMPSGPQVEYFPRQYYATPAQSPAQPTVTAAVSAVAPTAPIVSSYAQQQVDSQYKGYPTDPKLSIGNTSAAPAISTFPESPAATPGSSQVPSTRPITSTHTSQIFGCLPPTPAITPGVPQQQYSSQPASNLAMESHLPTPTFTPRLPTSPTNLASTTPSLGAAAPLNSTSSFSMSSISQSSHSNAPVAALDNTQNQPAASPVELPSNSEASSIPSSLSSGLLQGGSMFYDKSASPTVSTVPSVSATPVAPAPLAPVDIATSGDSFDNLALTRNVAQSMPPVPASLPAPTSLQSAYAGMPPQDMQSAAKNDESLGQYPPSAITPQPYLVSQAPPTPINPPNLRYPAPPPMMTSTDPSGAAIVPEVTTTDVKHHHSINYAGKVGAGLGKATKVTGDFLKSSTGKKVAAGAGAVLLTGFLGAGAFSLVGAGAEVFTSGAVDGMFESSSGGGDFSGSGGEAASANVGSGEGSGSSGSEAGMSEADQLAYAQDQLTCAQMQAQIQIQQMKHLNQLSAMNNAAVVQGGLSFSQAAGNCYKFY